MNHEPLTNNDVVVPTHIAVIMDGNRRWAKEKGLPALAGHRHVATKVLEPLIEHASKQGVKYMTFWAWSTENWQRSTKEVTGTMRIFRHVIADQWDRLHRNGVRVRTIGDLSKFPEDIQKSLREVQDQTKNNRRITAVFALNYGGRDEIIRAIKRLTETSILDTRYSKLDEGIFSQHLDTQGIPDPELIVRAGGEQRLSGFLLWQCQYSELYFPSWYMPDFTPERLDEAIEEYNRRKRRFGK